MLKGVEKSAFGRVGEIRIIRSREEWRAVVRVNSGAEAKEEEKYAVGPDSYYATCRP
jgi:hypothetical protein